MSKVVGRKFLSCLCALVSGIGMSVEAAVNNKEYSASIVEFPAALVNVKTSTENVVKKFSKLDPSDANLVSSYVDGKLSCVLGVDLVRKGRFCYFCFKLFVNMREDVPAKDKESSACIMSVGVHAEYVVERLGITEKDVPDNGSLVGFVNLGQNKFNLSKLFLKDVLGIELDEGYYSSANTSGVPYSPNNNGGVMTKASHPDYNDCFWRYFKKKIYDVFTGKGLLGKVLTAEEVNNDYQFEGVNQRGIHEYFFGTSEKPRMTNYYKAMHNTRWSAGARTGMTVSTIALLILGGYISVEKNWIDPMKDKSNDVAFASLKAEIRKLKIDVNKVHLYETLCGETGVGREIRKRVERNFKRNSTKTPNRRRSVPRNGVGRIKSRSLPNRMKVKGYETLW